MAGSCRSYVQWVYDETGDWATWEPGDRIDVGDIGYFDKSMKFTRADSAANLLGTTPDVHEIQRIGSRLHYSSRYFSVTSNAGGSIPGTAGASVTFDLKKGEGHVLQISKGACEGTRNESEILGAVKRAIIAEDWCLTWIIVCERTRVDSGFAVACRGRHASVTMGVNAALPQALTQDALARVGLEVVSSRGRVSHWQFSRGNTPMFDRTWRVRREMVDKFYGGNTRPVPFDQLYYRPDSSSITPDALDGMKARQIFEVEFSSSTL